MALAVTHIILTIIVLDFFRHYVFGKKAFPRYLLVIGGIAGLLPDIDIIMTWGYNFLTGRSVSLHGTFTHSLFWPILFLIVGVSFHYLKQKNWSKICYVTSVGLFFHIILDCLYGGYKTFFWPFSQNVISSGFCPQWGIHSYAASIDAIILVLWLVHEELHQMVKDYW
ncbi:metal-dependent hydrolase [Candidatus Woesearchaeota archaeon]|nr:metal-dependent hydrolase [Candidatus Woesearchaeota archaeon]